jgi:hypothetical protein
MLIVMWGFATAFNIALRRDQDAQEEYANILTSFLSMFEHQYGDMEFKPMWQTKSPKIATALAVAYTFVQAGACVTCTCTPANPRAVPTATWAPPPSIVTPPAASLLGARAAPPMQGTVIINLILGVVLTSLEKATQHEGMKMLLNQARIIDEIESTLPR